jgi:hypothetical protein
MKFNARKFLSGLIISSVFSNVCIAKNMEEEALDLIRTRVYDELNLELFSVSFENNSIPSTVDQIFNEIQQEINYNLSDFKDNIIEQIKKDKLKIESGNIDLSIYDLAIQILEREAKKPKTLAYDSLADGNHVIERLIHDYANRLYTEKFGIAKNV